MITFPIGLFRQPYIQALFLAQNKNIGMYKKIKPNVKYNIAHIEDDFLYKTSHSFSIFLCFCFRIKMP